MLIPPNGGLLSAYGMLFADVVKDYSQTVLWKTEDLGSNLQHELNNGFDTLLNRARDDMTSEGFDLSHLKIRRSLDMRYVGQSYELNVPYEEIDTDFVARFHGMHEKRFSYARHDTSAEIVTLRLSAIGETEKPTLTPEPLASSESLHAQIAENSVIFENEMYLTGFYKRESLLPGNRIMGPAVVTEFSATTIIPPNFDAVVDVYGNLILHQR